MNIADLSIRRPVFAWMLMSALVIFGGISYMRLGVSQMPDIDFPILDIAITYEGAAPEILENEVVDPIESRVIAVEGLKEVRSSVRQGSANVRLEFEIDRNIDAALQEVQAALSQLRLPPNIDPPTIRKTNPEEDPILIVGLAAKKPLREVLSFVDLSLIDQLQVVSGVGEVAIGGFSTRNLRIWVDNLKLRKNLLTVLDVVNAIETGHDEEAAGYLENSKRETNVRTLGEALSADEIGKLWIRSRGSEVIREAVLRVKDVARVEDGVSDIRRVARVNGEPGIAISVKKQRGSDEVEVGKRLRAKIAEINKTLPEGYRLQINADYTVFTEKTVKATTEKLWHAALFTALICWLFLGTWSSAVNVLFSIPTSVLGTFIVLYFSHFTLNLFTLLALALSISIIVDDAIMMLENIVRHFKMGKGRMRAASDGASEIWLAALATTVAVVAIFLPVIFMRGVIGKFFFQFGVTISTAVLLSLLEAVTLTPMRCSQMMRRHEKEGWVEVRAGVIFDYLSALYRHSLAFALRWRWSVVVISTLLFVLSIGLFAKLRKEFVPPTDQGLVFAAIQTPPGTSLTATDEATKKVEVWVKAQPEVDRYFSSVGSGGPSGQINNSFLGITLVPREKRSMNHVQFMEKLRNQFKAEKGLRLTTRDPSGRGLTAGRSFPVSFNIRGPEYSVLRDSSRKIMEKLTATGFVTDLDSDYKEGQPELRIVPNRLAAVNYGVTIQSIVRTIAAAIGGVKQGQFTSESRRYDIRVRLDAKERAVMDDIDKIQVRNYANELVPLSKLVTLNEGSTVQSVTRINRSRALAVFGNVAAGKSQGEALAVAEKISSEVLPPGYSFHLEGAAQSYDESFSSLYFALALGIAASYMVLASQFNSFLHPISVLLALPFSISGAIMTLWIFGESLSLYSMIGVLLLMGIAKKNSILIVEFTNRIRVELPNISIGEAQLKACPIRLRPILMTSIATVAAAIPLVIDRSAGFETRVPMALSIIGGTIVSTLFTLYVVPCAYNLFTRLESAPDSDEDDELTILSQ
jgi:hydrophobe/amphiphile efflux-1 (HAE1) family protein